MRKPKKVSSSTKGEVSRGLGYQGFLQMVYGFGFRKVHVTRLASDGGPPPVLSSIHTAIGAYACSLTRVRHEIPEDRRGQAGDRSRSKSSAVLAAETKRSWACSETLNPKP